MNQDKIERVAVRCVEEFVEKDERLKPQVNLADKEPLWDGYILLYETKEQRNKDIICRIPIQVKGKENGLYGDTISFQVGLEAMNQYKKEGIAYFVVDVTAKNVYYVLLDPIGVSEYINKTKAQKKCSIHLKRAEIHLNNFYNELRAFDLNCKRQISFVGKPLYSINDAIKCNGSIELIIPGQPTINTYRSLASYDVRAYWNKENIQFPLKKDYQIKGGCKSNLPISVNGTVFYSQYTCVFEENSFVIFLNKSTSFTLFDDESKPPQFKYKQTATTLTDLISGLEFLVAVIKYKGFSIGNTEVVGLDIDNKSAKSQELQLEYFRKIKSVLVQLHITDELDVTNLTESDYRNINLLIKAFIDNEPLTLPQKPSPTAYLEVSNLKICLLILETENGQYVMEDFFSRSKLVLLKIGEDSFEPVPSVYYISAQEYNEIANVDYDGIMPMIHQVGSMVHNYCHINKILLDLLSAYDLNNCNKAALDVAISLSEWLKNNCTGDRCRPNHIINYIQAIERAGMKGQKEDDILLDMVEEYHDRNDILVAANLLLGQDKVAMKHFGRLSVVEQNEFKKAPIGHYLTSYH